jgi:hypothetical protein
MEELLLLLLLLILLLLLLLLLLLFLPLLLVAAVAVAVVLVKVAAVAVVARGGSATVVQSGGVESTQAAFSQKLKHLRLKGAEANRRKPALGDGKLPQYAQKAPSPRPRRSGFLP